MALSSSSLKNKIIQELASRGFNINSGVRDKKAWMDEFIDAIAAGIINEIKSNAVTTTSSNHTHKIE